MLYDVADLVILLEDVLWFQRWHVLPAMGGKLEQDPRWLEAVEIFCLEEHRIKGVIDGTAGKSNSDQYRRA